MILISPVTDENALSIVEHGTSYILLTGDPFFDAPFILPGNNVDKVIIRAINCNGQRAKVQCLPLLMVLV